MVDSLVAGGGPLICEQGDNNGDPTEGWWAQISDCVDGPVEVRADAPGAGDLGLVVRNIPSGVQNVIVDSGDMTVNQGDHGDTSEGWWMQITDCVDGPVEVRADAPGAGDLGLVVRNIPSGVQEIDITAGDEITVNQGDSGTSADGWWVRLTDGTLNLNLRNTFPTVTTVAIPTRKTPLAPTWSIADSVSPPAGPTDTCCITGSATKTIGVMRFRITSFRGGIFTPPVYLIKRSTANTGGTFNNPAGVPHSTGFGAATATIYFYTVNPVGLGNRAGNIGATVAYQDTATTTFFMEHDWIFEDNHPFLLSGTSEWLCVNFNAMLTAPSAFAAEITWVEF